ncbi:DUF624 domain-containing protein [Ruminococcaceae bacterium OttesenSCG-928-L11]|nr:DUF624 domain-containing protein [Ruminococcaceae bacterium OttesenSCG-928-L11]
MAGFFGFFDYSKPGKGVRKDEPKKSHFVQFFILVQRKFWKLIQLNLLFILFCIPIVTIGPDISGMTYVLRNFATEQPVFLFSDFWDAFKSNFKQSFAYSIIFAVAAVVMYIAGSFYFANAAENALFYIPAGFIALIAVLFVFANFYIFPMIVTLDLPLKGIIKNGFLFSILGIKSNIFTAVILAILIFLLWMFYVIGFLVYVIIGFALIGFIIVFNSYRIIQKYAIDPYMEQLETEVALEGGQPAEEETVFSDEMLIKSRDDEETGK